MSKNLSIELRKDMSSVRYNIETDIDKYTVNDIFKHVIDVDYRKNFYQCLHHKQSKMYPMSSIDLDKPMKEIGINYGDNLCFFFII